MIDVLTRYESDLGEMIYYSPLGFVVSSLTNINQTALSRDQVVPAQIIAVIQDTDFVCKNDARITLRTIVVTDQNGITYTYVNPFRPTTSDFIAVTNELNNNTNIRSYKLIGEVIRSPLLDIVINKNG